jgi:hypothetical protein
MVMLEVRPLDARKQPLKPEYKFPYIEIDDMIFLRVPEDKMKAMQIDGSMDAFRGSLMQAADHSGTAFVKVPEVAAMLDRVMQEIQDTNPEDLKQSDVMMKIATVRNEILTNNLPTNKTFIILPEQVRFLEVKEKWEEVKGEAPQRPERKKKKD